MSAAAVILVHERDPYWVPELQRRFANEPVIIRRCAPLTDAEWQRLRGPYTVLVLDLNADPAASLKWLLSRATLPCDPVIVLASPELAEWEWTLRGAGVVSFHANAVPPRELVRLCRRLLAMDQNL